MKVLIDTNVLLDVLCDRAEFVDNSSKVFKYCEVKKIDGYISALSVPNIVYVMRKELSAEKTKEILEKLSLIFGTIDLKAEDLKKALELDFDDYEDALQCVAAKRIKAEYIITRNVKDFAKSPVTAITPSDFLKKIS